MTTSSFVSSAAHAHQEALRAILLFAYQGGDDAATEPGRGGAAAIVSRNGERSAVDEQRAAVARVQRGRQH